MKPHFETMQPSTGYVLKATIPDLRKEDLSHGAGTHSIEGKKW